MEVTGIQGPSFGIYAGHKINKIGKDTNYSITGNIKDKKLTVYTQYENGEKIGKLYYLEDKCMNWIKHKLQQFKNGKKIREINSQK